MVMVLLVPWALPELGLPAGRQNGDPRLSMPDEVTYAKQCIAFCFLTSTKQKASMSHRTWQKKQQSFFLLTPTILILHEMIWAWIGVGELDSDMELQACSSSCMSCIKSTNPFCTLLPARGVCTGDYYISFTFLEALPFFQLSPIYQHNLTTWRQTTKTKTVGLLFLFLKFLHSKSNTRVQREPM